MEAAPSPAMIAVMIAIPSVLLVFFLALVWWSRKGLLNLLNRTAHGQVQRLSSDHLRRVSMRQLLQLSQLFVRMVFAALVLGGVLVWLTAVLDVLPITHAWAQRMELALLNELTLLAYGALAALPGLGVVAVLFFLARVAHEMISHYFGSIERGEVESAAWDPVTAQTTRRLAGVAVWTAAVIVAYPYIPGSETAAFKGVTILAGLMLSLGSTNLVGQLVNGLVLIYSRAVRPGDVVVVDEVEGVLEKLSLFSCAIRTPEDELVWLPNSKLADGVRNRSRPASGAVRLTTQVTIGFDASWRQVRDLLLGAAADTPQVRKEPAPFVRQVALEDFYVRYELVFAPQDPVQGKAVLSDLHAAIQDRFHDAGVQIMSPHYLIDPAEAKIPRGTARARKADHGRQAE